MKKIRRKCKCGCGEITNYGKKYINKHYWRGKKMSEEAKERNSKSQRGRKHTEATKKKISEAHKGVKFSKEHRTKISEGLIKNNPNYEYCQIWLDKEYIKDIRKDYCENINCKNNYKLLDSHHLYLDKKRCAPNEIMTLCRSCHIILHRTLEEKRYKSANPKKYIIINRPNHVSYIHKKSRRIIRMIKRRRTSCMS